ncbi:hypothetical protein BD410DRAFT_810695 [Rickenella mellea]|uniref:Uncharacterized protein n=1 Tax=Rickenella mellea TaxID=50990 RepID=A0A4Y7PFY1_9AGAM|nr:hypothetical protein BD410DRAFT_810695 [Rickenella mellea]
MYNGLASRFETSTANLTSMVVLRGCDRNVREDRVRAGNRLPDRCGRFSGGVVGFEFRCDGLSLIFRDGSQCAVLDLYLFPHCGYTQSLQSGATSIRNITQPQRTWPHDQLALANGLMHTAHRTSPCYTHLFGVAMQHTICISHPHRVYGLRVTGQHENTSSQVVPDYGD